MRMPAGLLLLVCLLPAQERVRFQAADGHTLSGVYRAAEGMVKGGVLLLHMHLGNRTVFEPIHARLAARGFHALALDLRGHGESAAGPDGSTLPVGRETAADPETSPFLRMHLDARAGLEWLKEHGAPATSLAVIGASLGASVAWHCADENPGLIAALVLLTPLENAFGLDTPAHAADWGDRPALLVSGEDEADLGARTLKRLLPSPKVELRLLKETAVHGTRVFGRVPAIEADLIEWLEQSLAAGLVLDLPLTRDVVLDGRPDPGEGAGASEVRVPLEGGASALVRASRSKGRLLFGFDVPERHLRLNEVRIYVDVGGEGPPAPDAGCWRFSFNPAAAGRAPVQAARGDGGVWKDADAEGVMAYADTTARNRWTAEVALSSARLGLPDPPKPVRLGFEIAGSKKDQVRSWPPNPNLGSAPRVWVRARFP